ncbi:MAG: hypothetical protein HYU84_10335 [Chloroflexi bacterium]|nr:hypothetical protein [Chloroflexota bacterium]
MSPITQGQRIFFAVICAAALLVAVLGLFNPDYLAFIFTWLVLPPLHARFVGAIYLFGAVFMAGCLFAKRQAEVRWAVQLIGIWTGMLCIISILNLSAFGLNLLPVQIWFASYIIYPIVSIWMTFRDSASMKSAPLSGPALDSWAKNFLLAQGVISSLLAVILFLAPEFMSTFWPWKVTPILAQMYAGPLLSYGIGSLVYSKQEQWLGVRSIVPGMFSFTLVTVIISFMHFSLFSLTEIADLFWFAWFIVSSMLLGIMTLRSLKAT